MTQKEDVRFVYVRNELREPEGCIAYRFTIENDGENKKYTFKYGCSFLAADVDSWNRVRAKQIALGRLDKTEDEPSALNGTFKVTSPTWRQALSGLLKFISEQDVSFIDPSTNECRNGALPRKLQKKLCSTLNKDSINLKKEALSLVRGVSNEMYVDSTTKEKLRKLRLILQAMS